MTSIAQRSLDLQLSKIAGKDALLKPQFQYWSIAQHTLSQFLTARRTKSI